MRRLLLLLLTAALFCACAADPAPETTAPAPEPPVTLPPETTAPAVSQGIPLDTPCGTLLLPDSWDIPITTEATLGDPMVIRFFAEDVPLYDMTFSTIPSDDAVGTVTADDELLFLGLRLHPLEAETDLLLDMQESVNALLSQLPLQALAEAPDPDGAGEDLQILTPWGTLHFPRMWEDCLLTEQPAFDTIIFSCSLPDHDPVPLFTLTFDSNLGPVTAVITDADGTTTPVSLTVAEPEFDGSWSPDETDLFYAMQEDVNYLLGSLS